MRVVTLTVVALVMAGCQPTPTMVPIRGTVATPTSTVTLAPTPTKVEIERSDPIITGLYSGDREARLDAIRRIVRIWRRNAEPSLREEEVRSSLDRQLASGLPPGDKPSEQKLNVWRAAVRQDAFYSDQPRFIQSLAEAVGDGYPEIHEQAALALSLLGPDGKSAVPVLLQRLRDENPEVRCLAAEVLWWVDRNPAIAEVLEAELRSGDAKRRRRVILLLGRLTGDPAKDDEHRLGEMILEIRRAANSKYSVESQHAKHGVIEEEYKDAILSTIQHFVTTDKDFAKFASARDGLLIRALADTGDASDPACVKLLARFPDAVAESLGQFADKPDPTSKRFAVWIEAASHLIREGDPANRQKALDAIQKLGPAGASAIPALTAALSQSNPRVRQQAAEMLHKFGPAAKMAIPALVQALKDDDLDARYAAGQALKAIDPETAKKALVP